MPYDYDLFVIGGGSGGVRAGRMAANYGARVAVAEEYRIGGTCVIRGCVPKKLFKYAAHFHEDFADSRGYGWTIENAKFDWSILLANKNKEIDRLNKIYISALINAGVEIFDSRAVLKDPHTVHLVSEDRDVSAETILIATGAAPSFPEGVEGIEHAISSNEAFYLAQLPGSIIIVGGGYIAVEFAGIFNGLGVKTDLIYRGEEILRGFDDDLRKNLHIEMEKKGITIKTGINVSKIMAEGQGQEKGYKVSLSDGSQMQAGLVMVATGRAPNTQNMGLVEAGVKLGASGEIIVDEFSNSSLANIYAVGDVTDRAALTPAAIREGAAFAETVFNNNRLAIDHRLIPTAVFCSPEIGTVGLSEAQARSEYDEIDVYKSTFRSLKHTLSGRDEKTTMKLVVDKASDRVLGVHILGPDAAEMIQCLGIAIKMGARKADFDATLAVHPTAVEELVTMREPVTSR